jgi:ABC-type glycerol-3-phosphate transport system permease component
LSRVPAFRNPDVHLQFGAVWGSLMAPATISMLPTLILFMVVEKYIVHLAIGGAVKG